MCACQGSMYIYIYPFNKFTYMPPTRSYVFVCSKNEAETTMSYLIGLCHKDHEKQRRIILTSVHSCASSYSSMLHARTYVA